MSKRLLVRDQRGERERLLVGTMTVGRDTRCDISDADPLLSRRHAEFVCRPDSLVVRDLNSRNGISVNGVKVQEAVLRPGDVVKIARLVMTYLGDLESARSALPRPAADAGRARLADDTTAPNAANTEKIEIAGGAVPGAPGPGPQDDRTRVAPPRSTQHAVLQGQVAVARMTPPARPAPSPAYPPARPAEPPSPGPPEADSDSTRPMIRDGESKTATPILPLSALAAAEAAGRPTAPPPSARVAPPIPPPARPPAPPPPVAAPPAPDPLADWSLELRPSVPDSPSQRPEAPPRVSASAGAGAVVPGPSPSGVRELVGSVLLALVAFALGALPLIIWRGRMAESLDRVLIVPTALTPGTMIVVFGPPLLVALGAGILLAWWLRRG
jgi:hypothetical protein